MNRTEIMQDIAHHVEEMVRRYGRRDDIEITFENLTKETISKFTGFQQKYYGLYVGGEFFLVWEMSSDTPDNLLYTVPVDGDSNLAAAYELMNLVHRKF